MAAHNFILSGSMAAPPTPLRRKIERTVRAEIKRVKTREARTKRSTHFEMPERKEENPIPRARGSLLRLPLPVAHLLHRPGITMYVFKRPVAVTE